MDNTAPVDLLLLQTWEKTNELEIREFKLTQLKHEAEEAEEAARNGGSSSLPPARLNGSASNGEERRRGRAEQADSEERLDRLVIIKLAEISGLVKGGQADYSVIIKVLPTDDHDRYKVRHKFRQVSCALLTDRLTNIVSLSCSSSAKKSKFT